MEITERNLYLRLVSTRLEGQVRLGQIVRAGVQIMNSEVGLGAFVVRPLLFTLACRNGAVVDLEVQRRAHIGAALGGDDGNTWEWLSDEALVARSHATVLEMRDVVQAALGEAMFQRTLSQAQQAAGLPVAHPVAAVEWVAERYGFAEQKTMDVLNAFLDRHDRSVWDLSSAVTRLLSVRRASTAQLRWNTLVAASSGSPNPKRVPSSPSQNHAAWLVTSLMRRMGLDRRVGRQPLEPAGPSFPSASPLLRWLCISR